MAWAQPTQPFLVLMHGLSGAGKTHVSGELIKLLGAVRIRSDIERKRAQQNEPPLVGAGVTDGSYSAKNTLATYYRLLELAHGLLQAGFNVIVDACLLQIQQRLLFKMLARTCGVGFAICDVQASDSLMRARIDRRAREGNDASEATADVLEHQIRSQENFSPEEIADVVTYESKHDQLFAANGSACKKLQQLVLRK